MKGFYVSELENLVKKHGEKYRRLIEESLRWIEHLEKASNFDSPMDHEAFIASVIKEQL